MPSNMPSCIVASIPGRLRIRSRRLKNPILLEKLGTALTGLDSSCSYQANSRAGSLLFFYDAKQCVKTEMEAAIVKTVHDALPSVSSKPAASSASTVSASRKRRTLLRKANRCSKYVMYASLGTSLALAARGAKYGHAVAGAVFVAALGVHLMVHRKHLFS